jgi:hypothetical protein
MAITKFSNVHGTPAQRFFNVLCIAYGADQKLFADVVEKKYLPEDRADGCVDEVRAGGLCVQDAYRPAHRQDAGGKGAAQLDAGG